MHLDLTEEEIENLEKDERFGWVIGKYEIIGVIPSTKKGEVKMYIFKCRVCAEDPYLFGLGIFATFYYSIIHSNPCGCARGYKAPEHIKYKKIKRIVEDYGFIFKGFSEEYKGGSTKCLVECPEHGENTNCSANNITIYNRPTCWGCFSEHMRTSRSDTDEECISKFKKSGGFHEDTIFYRSDRRSNKGRNELWFMLCGNVDGNSSGLC